MKKLKPTEVRDGSLDCHNCCGESVTKKTRSGERRFAMTFEARVENLWQNPYEVDLSGHIVFLIRIKDGDGNEWRHVGCGLAKNRIRAFKSNLLKMRAGDSPRSGNDKFRPVHLKLYQAVEENWDYECYPLKACATSQEAFDERRLLRSEMDYNL